MLLRRAVILCGALVIIMQNHEMAKVVPVEGHCLWYGSCRASYDHIYSPCSYIGPPKPLQNITLTAFDNKTAVELLQEFCPELATGNDPVLCCDYQILSQLVEHIFIIDAMGAFRCPSCRENVRIFTCNSVCSTEQSRFMQVNRTEVFHGREVVQEINLHIYKKYAYDMYDSCKGVRGLIPGTLILDFACKHRGAKRCGPERWLDFMGSTIDEGGYSPIKANTQLHVTTEVEIDGQIFYPLKFHASKCSESPGRHFEECSCSDCKDSCAADILIPPELPPLDEPFTIYDRDGFAMIAWFLFFLLFSFTSIFFCFMHFRSKSLYN